MVSKFVQPDRATKSLDDVGAQAWMGEIESALPVLSSTLGQFAPYASNPASLTVNVSAGAVSHALGIAANAVAGGASEAGSLNSVGIQSASFVAPTVNPRIDRLCIDVLSGTLKTVIGVESANPVASPYPDGVIPVCRVALSVGQTRITNAHLTDERAVPGGQFSAEVMGQAASPYGSGAAYKIFSVAGTYSFPKIPNASFYRITMIGAGGGGGGKYIAANYSTEHLGGCGGGGGTAIVMCAADQLNIVVGLGGVSGLSPTMGGLNDSTAGSAGTATTVTLLSSGAVLTANPGQGGARAISTPAVGAGGAGGAATHGGFAGGAGGAGIIQGYSYSTYDGGGATGERGVFLPTMTRRSMGVGGSSGGVGDLVSKNAWGADGFVLVEWF